jgi:hypothetical protein
MSGKKFIPVVCTLVLCLGLSAFSQGPENVALMGTATVSEFGYGWVPERAIDGNYGTGVHSAAATAGEWLEIALDQPYDLTKIRLVNRADCCSERILGNIVIAMDSDRNVLYTSEPIAEGDAPGSIHSFDNGGAGFAGVSIIRVEQTADAFVQIMEVEALLPYPYAYNPMPADGTDELVDPPTLQWTAADGAVAYNVYVSADAVIDDADLVATIAETELALTDPLIAGATYSWRVNAVDAGDNASEGDVWQFAAMPVEAHFPVPVDGATLQPINTQLSWTAGLGALVHNVYMSTDPNLVEARDPNVQAAQWLSDAAFDPGALENETTYYWAVDEFLGASTNPGPVWSFTTVFGIPITDPNLLIHYSFETGEGKIVIDQSGHGNTAEFFGTPEWTTGIDGGGLAFNLDEVDYIQTNAPLGIVTNTVTVSGWVIHDEAPAAWSGILTHRGTSPGNLGLQHNGTELRYMWGADQYWSFESGLNLPLGEWYFAALAIGPDQGKLYLNGAEATATNVAEHVPTNFDSLIRVARDHSDGRIMTCTLDDVRLYNKTLTDAEIAMLAGTAYVEGFEAYEVGTDLHGVNNWEGWEGTAGAGAPVSDAQAASGANSVEIISSADLVKKLSVTGGQITLSALQYIPAGGSGDTFFILMNQYAPNPLDWSSQTKFSLGSGQINDDQATIVTDEWVELMYVIDLDNNTVEEYYNGAMFNSGEWDGDAHNTLQAIDLYSAGASSVYYDDITIEATLMPVGLWKFDEGAGDVAMDSSGNMNDGTITDATWVEGLDGGALDMAGVGYVQVPAEAWMSVENEMTVAFWAFGDPAVMPQSHTVFAAYSDAENNNARIASAHIPWGNGNVYFDTGGTPESGGYDRISAAASPEEQGGGWRHWAFVKDAVTGDQQIYLDGVLWHSGTGLTRPMAGVTAFTIGARNNGGEVYPGIIDDFRVYDQALSGVQIYRLATP